MLQYCYLGRMDYQVALKLQLKLKQALLEGAGRDTLLLMEHPPVITLGRTASRENILLQHDERLKHEVQLVEISRGGDVTYHGPGQLVGYPVRWVGRAIRKHLHGISQAIVSALKTYSIESWWDDKLPGVWTHQGKIAAVGVDARGGVTLHGFSLNVFPNLDHYQWIVPCGLMSPVTSIQAICGQQHTPALENIAQHLAIELAKAYETPLEPITPEQLFEAYTIEG